MAIGSATTRPHWLFSWFGGLLRDRRKALGVSLPRMASKIGSWPGRLCELERGARLPHPRTLRRLSKGYEVPADALLTIRDLTLYHAKRPYLRRAVRAARLEVSRAVLLSRMANRSALKSMGLLRAVEAKLAEHRKEPGRP